MGVRFNPIQQPSTIPDGLRNHPPTYKVALTIYSSPFRLESIPHAGAAFHLLDHLNQAPVQHTVVVCTPHTDFQILDASSLTFII